MLIQCRFYPSPVLYQVDWFIRFKELWQWIKCFTFISLNSDSNIFVYIDMFDAKLAGLSIVFPIINILTH